MAISNYKFVAYIHDHPNVKPKELADLLGVGERSVRTYVRRANESLNSAAKVLLKYGGYSLAIFDQNGFSSWVERNNRRYKGSSIPTTFQERVAYLTEDLLLRDDFITIDELAGSLYVSGTTISHDLAQVESNIKSFGLELERRPRHGIRVVGDEKTRRLCIASLPVASIAQKLSVADGDVHELLTSIGACVDVALSTNGIAMSAMSHRNLMVHIAVALLRMQSGCYMPPTERFEKLEGTHSHKAACDIARELSQEFSVELSKEEILYMAVHLAGKQMLPSADNSENGVVISEEVWCVVSLMLETVLNVFNFDLRDNLELRMNLARHIVPLSYRLKCHMPLKNPMLRAIRERYPLAWSMAAESSIVLADAYGAAPSDDEIGYIALTFALALGREESQVVGKNIVIVCASGVGTARLLEYLYRNEFGKWLESIETCDLNHIDEVDFSNVDYVFTTVPLDKSLPVPVREVSMFMDESEVRDIRCILSNEIHPSGDSLSDYFDEKLFFPNLEATTREEALDYLCDRRIAFGGAGKDFKELVFRREELMYTTFGDNVAMPHPLEAVSDSTLITVGVTKAPIPWGEHEIQVIFLLSVAKDAPINHILYDSLAKIMIDGSSISKLANEPTWGVLTGLLNGET